MGQKTVVECDGVDCLTEAEYEGCGFLIIDATNDGWFWDENSDCFFCPGCKLILNDDVEVIADVES